MWRLLLPIALWLTSCGPSASAPASETSSASTDGPRIAALAPAIASTLQQLNLGDRIVARHAYDVTLDPSIPSAGDQSGLDYETLIRADPTHVLLDWGERDIPTRLRTLADERGWIIEILRMTTLDETRDAFAGLAARFGVNDSLTPALDEALRARPERARVGRVLLLMRASPPEALGPGGHHHEILVALGATPALTTGASWQSLDAEDLRRIDPDAVILVSPNANDAPPALPIEPAHVGVLNRPDAWLAGGPSIRFAEDLARTLDAWAAAQPSD
ncbi:MAG: hypothetical protein AAGK04_10155 [Planctomycetota bacterium]